MIAWSTCASEGGIGLCNITKCCTKVCPEDIHITDNAIIPLKERVVDRFYDPVKRLFRVFGGGLSADGAQEDLAGGAAGGVGEGGALSAA